MKGDFRDEAERFRELDDAALDKFNCMMEEVVSAADHLCLMGLTGKDGEFLPMNMSCGAVVWINENRALFRKYIRLAKKSRGLE